MRAKVLGVSSGVKEQGGCTIWDQWSRSSLFLSDYRVLDDQRPMGFGFNPFRDSTLGPQRAARGGYRRGSDKSDFLHSGGKMTLLLYFRVPPFYSRDNGGPFFFLFIHIGTGCNNAPKKKNRVELVFWRKIAAE